MPSLDRLQTLLGSEGLKVIALSLDRAGNAAVTAFMEELGLTSMEAFLDSGNQSARDFVVQGLPATFIIDPSGGLVGGLLGPAEWDSPDALMLLPTTCLDQNGRASKICSVLRDEAVGMKCCAPRAPSAWAPARRWSSRKTRVPTCGRSSRLPRI